MRIRNLQVNVNGTLFGQDEFAAARDLQQITFGGVFDPDALRTAEQFSRADHAVGDRTWRGRR